MTVQDFPRVSHTFPPGDGGDVVSLSAEAAGGVGVVCVRMTVGEPSLSSVELRFANDLRGFALATAVLARVSDDVVRRASVELRLGNDLRGFPLAAVAPERVSDDVVRRAFGDFAEHVGEWYPELCGHLLARELRRLGGLSC